MFKGFHFNPGAGHLVNAVSGSGLLIPQGLQETQPSFLYRAGKLLTLWGRRIHERNELARLDDRCLADIGMSRCEADHEAGKPFWKE